MTPVLKTLALGLTFSGLAVAAQAQDVCIPAGEMRAALLEWHAERPLPGQEGQARQLWVSDRTGSWTMINFKSTGTACVTAQGRNWTPGLGKEDILAALQ